MRNLAELFTENLRRALDSRGWTQLQLAQATGMVPPAISRYLSGKNEPGFEVIERMAGVLDLEPWELLKPDAPDLPPTALEIVRLLRHLDQAQLGTILPMVRLMADSNRRLAEHDDLAEKRKNRK